MSPGPPPCPLCSGLEARLLLEDQGRSYFRCPECECAFLDPAQRLSRALEREHYHLHHNNPGDQGYRAFVAPLADALASQLDQGAAGLDFGSGSGSALAAMLRERGLVVREYDPLFRPDASALTVCHQFIACCEVAEHLHQPMLVFRQLASLLEPGGWLGLMTGLLEARTDFQLWHYRRDPTHVVFYSLESFHWLARRLGGWRVEHPARNVVLLQHRVS